MSKPNYLPLPLSQMTQTTFRLCGLVCAVSGERGGGNRFQHLDRNCAGKPTGLSCPSAAAASICPCSRVKRIRTLTWSIWASPMHRFNGALVLCCAPQAPLRSAALPITRQISLLQSGSELRFCLSRRWTLPHSSCRRIVCFVFPTPQLCHNSVP